ncbi:MAG: hypothetical protein ACLTC0_07580 [Eisenbergiella massiliensis]|uniref:hypothetical protein n=1 Tax=Eisenbergiella massiliensis TaxID=1720294 RepID=UPI0039963786
MKMKKRAWIYCHIDAPEDMHGALKEQQKLLMDYAEQMEFEITGSSCDTGSSILREENGLTHFYNAITKGKANIMIIMNSSFIVRYPSIGTQLMAFISLCKIQVYSPLFGRVYFQE